MIKIIGTGHVLQKSVHEVRIELLETKPDFVAVELDNTRYEILKENNFELNFGQRHIFVRNLFALSGLIQYLLSMLQQEFGKKLNVFPGAEMIEAILCAREINANVVLIDRNINITMNRLLNLPLKEKIRMLTLSPKTMPVDFKIDKIDGLLEPKNLNKITDIMKKFPKFYKGLIEERDMYMAVNLYKLQLKFPHSNIIAVVGAGHKEGIEKFLNKFENETRTNINTNINIASLKKIEKISLQTHIANIFFVFILFFAFLALKIKFLK